MNYEPIKIEKALKYIDWDNIYPGYSDYQIDALLKQSEDIANFYGYTIVGIREEIIREIRYNLAEKEGRIPTGKKFINITITKAIQIIKSKVVNCGLKDKQDRKIGHRFTIDREVCLPDKNGDLLWPVNYAKIMVGESFYFRHYSTRNGEDFGSFPLSGSKRFKTLQEAEIHAKHMTRLAKELLQEKL